MGSWSSAWKQVAVQSRSRTAPMIADRTRPTLPVSRGARTGTFGTGMSRKVTALTLFGTFPPPFTPHDFRGETACVAHFGTIWHCFSFSLFSAPFTSAASGMFWRSAAAIWHGLGEVCRRRVTVCRWFFTRSSFIASHFPPATSHSPFERRSFPPSIPRILTGVNIWRHISFACRRKSLPRKHLTALTFVQGFVRCADVGLVRKGAKPLCRKGLEISFPRSPLGPGKHPPLKKRRRIPLEVCRAAPTGGGFFPLL